MKIPDKFYFKPKSDDVLYYATRYKDIYFVSCGGAPAEKWSKEDLDSKILNGDFIAFTNKYRWQSVTTGEVVENFWKVLRAIWVDLTKFHFLNIRWEYNKEGF